MGHGEPKSALRGLLNTLARLKFKSTPMKPYYRTRIGGLLGKPK